MSAPDRSNAPAGAAVVFRKMIAEDALIIERQASQRVQLGLEHVMTPEIAEDLAEGGEAWTAVLDDRVIACVGLRETFAPVQAVAWAILTQGIGAAHLAVTRFTADRIARSTYRRIEAVCIAAVDAEAILTAFPGLDPAQLLEAVMCVRGPQLRWAKLLGLEPAHVLRRFGAASETHVLFERIL